MAREHDVLSLYTLLFLFECCFARLNILIFLPTNNILVNR